jgi:hypothetical protein
LLRCDCGGPDSRPGDPLKINQFSRILQSKAPAVERPLTIVTAFDADSRFARAVARRLVRANRSKDPADRCRSCASRDHFRNSENKKKPDRNGRAF